MTKQKDKSLEEREQEMRERHVRDDEIVSLTSKILMPIMIIGTIAVIIWAVLYV